MGSGVDVAKTLRIASPNGTIGTDPGEVMRGASAGRRRFGAVLAAVLAMATFGTAVAAADPGDLSYANCVGNNPGCAPTNPPAALTGASAVAVTPDGKHLYALGTNGVSHFLVDATGAITFAGCV